MTTPAPKKFEFDEPFQRKILAMTWRDPTFAARTDGLVDPSYFQNSADGVLISVAQDFYKKYKKSPDKSSFNRLLKDGLISGRIPKSMWPDVKERFGQLLSVPVSDRDFLTDKVSEFAQERAMETAIMDSVPLLEKGDYASILAKVRAACDVGAQEDSGDYSYFDEIDSRTDHRVALAAGTIKPSGITTGFPDLDKWMYHGGWGRKELSVIMGRAKFGKSMGLGEFGKSAWLAGYNVFIASCEVSREIYAERLDANFADTAMKLLKDSPFDVRTRIKDIEAAAKTKAAFEIRDYATGSLKNSQLRRTLERYRNRGIIFDLIITDYADIMSAEKPSGDLITDSMDIWIGQRALAYEQNAAVLTATQTNRSGAKAHVAEATDVASDYNKIRIADLVISGNANDAEIASGEARLKFVASRNQESITLRIKQDRAKMKFLVKVLGKE